MDPRRRPADSGEDWAVGHLCVQRADGEGRMRRMKAATMNAPEEEAAYQAVVRALSSAASVSVTPTDAQIVTRMRRII